MKGNVDLYEEAGMVAENIQQHRESQEETSPLDGPLCAILALLLALVFFGFVVYYLSM